MGADRMAVHGPGMTEGSAPYGDNLCPLTLHNFSWADQPLYACFIPAVNTHWA